MKHEDGRSSYDVLQNKKTTFLFKNMFYQTISGSSVLDSTMNWVNSVLTIAEKCNFNEECCSGCKDLRIFDILVFGMQENAIKEEIQQKAIDGSINNFQDVIAFLTDTTKNGDSSFEDQENFIHEDYSQPEEIIADENKQMNPRNLKKNQVTCNICFVTISNRKTLRKHKLQKHDGEGVLKKRDLLLCDFCGERMPDIASRTEHENEHLRGLNTWTCPVCSIKASSKYLLEQHISFKHCDTSSCLLCDESLSKSASLAHHYTSVHGCGENRKCNICLEVFEIPANLLRHYQSHLGFMEENSVDIKVKPFGGNCLKCSKPFFRKIDLEEHTKDFHNEEPCPHCGLNFPYKTKLKQHIETEHYDKVNSEMVMCSKCPRRFPSERLLKLHQRRKHPDDAELSGRKRTNIDRKTKEFKIIKNIGGPLVRNKEVDPNKEVRDTTTFCEQCGGRFKNKASLRGHIRTVHKKIRNFPCDRCEARFQSASHLRTHMIAHDKVKEFECLKCNKLFSYYQNIQSHMMSVHKTPKPEVPPFVKRLEVPLNMPERKPRRPNSPDFG